MSLKQLIQRLDDPPINDNHLVKLTRDAREKLELYYYLLRWLSESMESPNFNKENAKQMIDKLAPSGELPMNKIIIKG